MTELFTPRRVVHISTCSTARINWSINSRKLYPQQGVRPRDTFVLFAHIDDQRRLWTTTRSSTRRRARQFTRRSSSNYFCYHSALSVQKTMPRCRRSRGGRKSGFHGFRAIRHADAAKKGMTNCDQDIGTRGDSRATHACDITLRRPTPTTTPTVYEQNKTKQNKQ